MERFALKESPTFHRLQKHLWYVFLRTSGHVPFETRIEFCCFRPSLCMRSNDYAIDPLNLHFPSQHAVKKHQSSGLAVVVAHT